MYVLRKIQYVLRKEHSIGPGLRVSAEVVAETRTRD